MRLAVPRQAAGQSSAPVRAIARRIGNHDQLIEEAGVFGGINEFDVEGFAGSNGTCELASDVILLR